MKYSRLFFILCTLFLISSLVVFPKEMLDASFESVTLWFYMVFPSLFPFLVATDVLVRLGAADSAGRALQPLMTWVWGLPGISAFPFVLGLISGYPVGAKITATLFEEGAISPREAQHILSFCNNPGPLFVIGTVGTAMLKNPMYGYFILVCTFCSSIVSGILFRFLLPKENHILRRFTTKPKKNTDSFGMLIGMSVKSSLNTVAQIGGFIILFGVFLKAIEQTQILVLIGHILSKLLPLSEEIITYFISGLLEMTNGASLFSKLNCSTYQRIIGITMLLSFGGLSVLGQTLSILANTPIHTRTYVLSKIVNSIVAGLFAAILYPWFVLLLPKTVPVFALFSRGIFHPSYAPILSLVFMGCAVAFAKYKCKNLS